MIANSKDLLMVLTLDCSQQIVTLVGLSKEEVGRERQAGKWVLA